MINEHNFKATGKHSILKCSLKNYDLKNVNQLNK